MMSFMNVRIMIQALIKSFGRSTDKRTDAKINIDIANYRYIINVDSEKHDL